MGKKYIIEVEDKPFELLSGDGFTSEKLFRVKGFNSLVFDWNGLQMLTPYTEDSAYAHGYTEAESKYREIRDELEKQAYQRGLADAWDAARKIGSNSMCSLKEMGFDFSQCAVSDYNPSWFVVKNYSASEAIEKIRAYEQRQEEIKVGDEVITASGKAVVMGVGPVHFEYVYADGSHGYDEVKNVKKTGRNFPEIAEVLQKMREGQEQ